MSVVASLPYLLRLARRGAIPLTVLLLYMHRTLRHFARLQCAAVVCQRAFRVLHGDKWVKATHVQRVFRGLRGRYGMMLWVR